MVDFLAAIAGQPVLTAEVKESVPCRPSRGWIGGEAPAEWTWRPGHEILADPPLAG